MPVHGPEYHERQFNLVQALGDPLIAADAVLVPSGFEAVHCLIKNFAMPVVSSAGEIEHALPAGGMGYKQQPLRCSFTSAVQIKETSTFAAQTFIRDVINAGGYFDARIYEGTLEKYLRTYRLRSCFLTLEPAERDWENRGMLLYYSGSIFGHYFGETEPGNTA